MPIKWNELLNDHAKDKRVFKDLTECFIGKYLNKSENIFNSRGHKWCNAFRCYKFSGKWSCYESYEFLHKLAGVSEYLIDQW